MSRCLLLGKISPLAYRETKNEYITRITKFCQQAAANLEGITLLQIRRGNTSSAP